MDILKKPVILIAAIVAVVLIYLFLSGFHLPGFITDSSQPSKTPIPAAFLKAPEGFIISVFAKDLKDPRVIAFDSEGRMLVSETAEGKVLILEDKNKDGIADETKILLEGLNKPHGLAFYTDPKTKTVYLYIAETNQVARYKYDTKNGLVTEKTGTNIVNLPADGLNAYRNIAFGPNYQVQPITNTLREETMSEIKLYVSVGSSCEACIEQSWKNGSILESDPDGNYAAELAGGLRNSLFFDFNPITKKIWAAENSRGDLGSSLPPDEINIIEPNKKYGWPFCYGRQIKDASFNPAKINRTDIPQDCNLTQPSIVEIPAHSAPLGLAFADSSIWPGDWQNNLLVAYHGSADGQKTRQPKIVRFKIGADGRFVGVEEDFITGWSGASGTIGRPVDLKFGPDGALYVSDDYSGQIYRVERGR